MNITNYNHRTMEKEVVELWNACFEFDSITIEKFRAQAIYDENFDPELCWVALEEEKIVGFILGTKRKYPFMEKGLEENKAWINVIFVKKEYRRQGIAQALLDAVEKRLIEKGAKELILGAYSPHYFFPGLDPKHHKEATIFFEKNGYKPSSTHYSMGKDLRGYKLTDEILERKKKAEEKGYRFLPYQDEYCLDVLEFLKREFSGSWKFHALEAMRKKKAEERLFIVLDPRGEVCGCANRAIDENEMRFGPIGIAKSERNNGLGSILLECALYEMSKRGIERMFFMTTDEAGKRYYLRNGLEVIREFVHYEKNIKKSVI